MVQIERFINWRPLVAVSRLKMESEWNRKFLFDEGVLIPLSECTWSHYYKLKSDIDDLNYKYGRLQHPPGTYYWTLKAKWQFRRDVKRSLKQRKVPNPFKQSDSVLIENFLGVSCPRSLVIRNHEHLMPIVSKLITMIQSSDDTFIRYLLCTVHVSSLR